MTCSDPTQGSTGGGPVDPNDRPAPHRPPVKRGGRVPAGSPPPPPRTRAAPPPPPLASRPNPSMSVGEFRAGRRPTQPPPVRRPDPFRDYETPLDPWPMRVRRAIRRLTGRPRVDVRVWSDSHRTYKNTRPPT